MATVTGPTSSTNTAIARWNGMSGTVIEDSSVTLDGSGNLAGVASLAGSVTTTTQSPGDNSTKIATTAYVDTGLNSLSLNSLSDAATNYSNNNMFLGSAVGATITSGIENTGLGSGSMATITSGGANTAFGYSGLFALTTGASNVAVGASALVSATTGSDNVAVGFAALSGCTTATGNVAIGYEAALSTVTGSNNVCIGPSTSSAFDTPNVVAIGNSASSGARSVAIGFDAAAATDSTNSFNCIAIGLQASCLGTDSVAIGANASVAAGTGNSIAIGHSVLVSTGNFVAIGNSQITDVLLGGSTGTNVGSSLNLTGNPTTTTQSPGDDSTRIATTAYVDAAVATITAVVLTGYMSGCLVTNDTSTPNTQVDIDVGTATDSSGASYIASAGYTVDLGSSGAVNELDTGTLAASSWYHIFVIAKADGTTGGLASLSATSPTLPSGYAIFRRVGSVRTNASAQILGFRASYTGGGTTTQYWSASVLDISTTTLGTTSTSFTLSTPTGVSCEAIMQYFLSTAGFIYIRSLDQPDEAPSGTVAPMFTHGSSGGGANQGGDHIRMKTNTSSQIAMRANAASTGVKAATLGWMDYRGT